jgi:hypothetical protein
MGQGDQGGELEGGVRLHGHVARMSASEIRGERGS